MGVLLFSPSDKVTTQMLQMKYDPHKGLGKIQEGRVYPVQLHSNFQRQGLGYTQDLP